MIDIGLVVSQVPANMSFFSSLYFYSFSDACQWGNKVDDKNSSNRYICLTKGQSSKCQIGQTDLAILRYGQHKVHRPGSVEVIRYGILASAVAKGASRSCLEKKRKTIWSPTHWLMFYIYLHILISDQTNLVERLMAV